MDIHQERRDRVLVVAPAGRLDTTTTDALEQALTAALEAGELRLVVDFGGVSYISSVGLRAMLVAAKRMKERRGTLVLCAFGDAVRQVFELAGFLPLFTVEPTRELAVARCAQGA
jgi:anti-sigma B factor antagonist